MRPKFNFILNFAEKNKKMNSNIISETCEDKKLDEESVPNHKSLYNDNDELFYKEPSVKKELLFTKNQEVLINKFVKSNPSIFEKYLNQYDSVQFKKQSFEKSGFTKGEDDYNEEVPWIQTYSGFRFTPTIPNINSIVIQDIAHALSMQCRFSGHCNKFYSVAQHSVLVSYVCDFKDALHGLMHDASEAYMHDLVTPLKKSGMFEAYIKYEKQLQEVIYDKFELSNIEPESVKVADSIILATEARDLMAPLRVDWPRLKQPLPMFIIPVSQEEAKKMFLERFYELKDMQYAYSENINTLNKVKI